MRPLVVTVQVRTRILDDVARAFANDGGRQVVLLGAGYDCRAARLFHEGGVAVIEVDHPATQAYKRAVLAGEGNARYVPFDFAARPLDELGAALASAGHDAKEPTLFVWEGVTMYLPESAVDATVRAVAALSAPSSLLAFTYFTPDAVKPRSLLARAALRMVLGKVEPLVFGFDPAVVDGWLAERGFALALDKSVAELAPSLLPAAWTPFTAGARTQHVVVAQRSPA